MRRVFVKHAHQNFDVYVVVELMNCMIPYNHNNSNQLDISTPQVIPRELVPNLGGLGTALEESETWRQHGHDVEGATPEGKDTFTKKDGGWKRKKTSQNVWGIHITSINYDKLLSKPLNSWNWTAHNRPGTSPPSVSGCFGLMSQAGRINNRSAEAHASAAKRSPSSLQVDKDYPSSQKNSFRQTTMCRKKHQSQ